MSVYTEHSDQEIEIEQIYNNITNPLTTSKPKEIILQQLYQIEKCVICYLPMCKNLTTTTCGHVFHKNCIRQSVTTKQECPCCRSATELDSLMDLYYSVEQKMIDVSDREEFKFEDLKAALEAVNHQTNISTDQNPVECNQANEILEKNEKQIKNMIMAWQKIDLEHRDLLNKFELERGLNIGFKKVKDDLQATVNKLKTELDITRQQNQKLSRDCDQLKLNFVKKLDECKNLKNELFEMEIIKLKYDVLINMEEIHYKDILENPNASLDSKVRLFYEKLISLESKIRISDMQSIKDQELVEKAQNKEKIAKNKCAELSKKVDMLEKEKNSLKLVLENSAKKQKNLTDQNKQLQKSASKNDRQSINIGNVDEKLWNISKKSSEKFEFPQQLNAQVIRMKSVPLESYNPSNEPENLQLFNITTQEIIEDKRTQERDQHQLYLEKRIEPEDKIDMLSVQDVVLKQAITQNGSEDQINAWVIDKKPQQIQKKAVKKIQMGSLLSMATSKLINDPNDKKYDLFNKKENQKTSAESPWSNFFNKKR